MCGYNLAASICAVHFQQWLPVPADRYTVDLPLQTRHTGRCQNHIRLVLTYEGALSLIWLFTFLQWVTCSHVVWIQASGLTRMTFLALLGNLNADVWNVISPSWKAYFRTILVEFFVWNWQGQSASFVREAFAIGRESAVQASGYHQLVQPHCYLLTSMEVRNSDWLPRRTLVQSPSGFQAQGPSFPHI